MKTQPTNKELMEDIKKEMQLLKQDVLKLLNQKHKLNHK